ncbi:hypothetical protein MB02_01330 [Croceicoccus estronivorus]|nr:hypothetical protein MB02_01330 [Croceicoccus estronivorus]
MAASPAEESRHTVQDGETLNGIANRAGVPASAVAKANGLKPPFAVRVGQVLVIPRDASTETTHVVQAGETLNGIANRAGVSSSALAAANALKPPFPVRLGQRLTIPRKRAAGSPTTQDQRAARPGGTGDYIVQPGETLNGIANRAGVPRIAIIEANGLAAPYVVKTGRKLRIPHQHVHTVTEGDTGFGISFAYGVPYDQILTANGLAADTVLKPGQKLVIPALVAQPDSAKASDSAPARPDNGFRWPLTGAILSSFDPQAPGGGHKGIDIDTSVGAPVAAAKAGRVIYAGEEPIRYGKMIVIEHEGQWYSAYGHLSSIAVQKGTNVATGDMIGHAGSTGAAIQPELHFELRHKNQAVDPMTQLGPPPAP